MSKTSADIRNARPPGPGGQRLINAALLPLSPILLGYAIARDLQRIGPESLRDRWGRPEIQRSPGAPCVWIHAASVGETTASAPIIEAVRAAHPEVEIVFSSITATGHETALRLFREARCIYFPYDTPLAIRNAMRRIQPDVCVIVEKEYWPNFLYQARVRGAGPVLVNGRISDRMLRRATRPLVRPVVKRMFESLNCIGVQSEEDAARAIELGANPERVVVGGNTKFENAMAPTPPAEEVAETLGFPQGLATLVAGSTHPGEDEQIIEAFIEVRRAVPDARLMIAPRHLQRAPALRQLLRQRGLPARFRSEERKSGAHGPVSAPVFVLDTLGELRQVYALARVAFVGGTLTPIGGHDLLQPLAQGVPVLFGPHTHNCREIAEAVQQAGAGSRVKDWRVLAQQWQQLLQDSEVAQLMGSAGRQLIEQNRGASDRYARIILDELKRRN